MTTLTASIELTCRFLTGLALTVIFIRSAQSQTPPDSIRIVKGSYLYYGHAAIEDNSMFLEEAFNQGSGVVQFISGTLVTDKAVETAFEVEVPLAGEKHQISFGSSYSYSVNNAVDAPEGVGEIRISYRPQISGKHHWAMVIPRLTIAIPRKNSLDEFRYNRLDVEIAIAVTKRLHRTFTSHFNAGTTYRFDNRSNTFVAHTFAGSLIWTVRPKLNFMLESVYKKSTNEIGHPEAQTIVNPAFRFSFPVGHYRVIPGLGVPLFITETSQFRPGVIINLSIEPF